MNEQIKEKLNKIKADYFMDTPDWSEGFDDGVNEALKLLSSQWRDISTAPKDESYILILAEGQVYKARYFCGEWTQPYTADYDNDYGEVINPTHWQPLPEPPKE